MFFKPVYDKDLRLSTSILKHLSNVILGFIPRIHAKHTPMDPRVKTEYDNQMKLFSNIKGQSLKTPPHHTILF